jgi:hypothetical protein
LWFYGNSKRLSFLIVLLNFYLRVWKRKELKMIAEKPNWIRHEGMQIFSVDVQLGGLRFATRGGDHKV